MTLRRIWLALGAFMLAGCSTGVQPGGVAALNPTTSSEGAVAQITYRDTTVEYISQNTLDTLRNGIYLDPSRGPAPEEVILNELITRRLLLRQGRNADIAADPEAVSRAIESISSNAQFCQGRAQSEPGTTEASRRAFFDECARGYGFENGDGFRNFIVEELTVNAVGEQQAPKDLIKPTHILFDDFVAAQQTYAELCGGESNATQPEEDATCRGSGANFADLVRERSTEPNADQTEGELPPFDAQGNIYSEQGVPEQGSSFDATFVTNTLALRPAFEAGEPAISQPFQTQFGWHIVRISQLLASQDSVQNYRQAILDRAINADVAELAQPETDQQVPLIGKVEILKDLPEPSALPTIEAPVPEITPEPDATSSVPAEGTAEPEATDESEAPTTATAESTAAAN